MKWEKVTEEFYHIIINRTQVVSLSYSCADKGWIVSFEDWSFLLHANTPEEALWKATIKVYNKCNDIANAYHRIRDNLPDIEELANAAGVI